MSPALEGASGSAGRTESASAVLLVPDRRNLLVAWLADRQSREGDSMPTLPSNPNLEQLRHQARDLLRAARAGEREATERIRAVSGRVTLSSAQLAIAREYGLASWPALRAEVEERARTLAEAVEEFLALSIGGRLGRAIQLLGRYPEISDYDVRIAIALGDAARVGAELERDPDLPVRRDPRTGWTALHLACASRWHADPVRAEGLSAVVGLLLDAGADLDRPPTADSQWSPLRCAVASTMSGRGNEPIVHLLLERGAKVQDHDLYLAGFAEGGQWCLRLLVRYTPDVRAIAAQALAAPISLKDIEGVRVLLDAGADPRRYRDDDGHPAGVVLVAIAARCGLRLIELLLAHGADPDETGEDGRSAYAVAMASGRDDLVKLLTHYGARDDATPLDRLRYACLTRDRTSALKLLEQYPALRSELAGTDGSTLISAAENGNAQAIELLLEAGFPATAEGRFNPAGVDGATALHAAAWAGNAEAIERLLAAGAQVDTLDSNWESTPLMWALTGSSERRATNPNPNWVETVRTLLDAGADTSQINPDPDAPHYPSPEVVKFLRTRGILPRAET
jgi:Ankyrin repeats (3 copies)/Ankyrin repeat